MILYKYVKIDEHSIDSLSNKYFYCSRPCQLNDLFDCHIPVKHNDSDRKIQKWLNINLPLFGINDGERDFPFFSVQDVKNAFLDGRFDQYIFRKVREKDFMFLHIFCLSKEDCNEVLWGNYADSYKGMCVAYKAKDFFNGDLSYYGLAVKGNKIEKSNCFTEFNGKLYFRIQDVVYLDEKSDGYDCIGWEHDFNSSFYDFPDEFVNKFLYKKKSNWSYEKECRGIFHKNSDKDTDCRLFYEDEVLDSITFGYNVNEVDINKIKTIVKEKYKNADKIKFYKIVPDYSKRQLIKELC